jgi:hypothetical protein
MIVFHKILNERIVFAAPRASMYRCLLKECFTRSYVIMMVPNCKQQKKDVKFLANRDDEHKKRMKDVTF